MNKTKIRRIVRAIAPSVRVFFARGATSYYDHNIEKINLDYNDMNVEEDGGFLYHLCHEHKCIFAYDIPFVVWTLLHEIGHHFTLDEVYENESDDDEWQNTLIKWYCAEHTREEAQNNPNLAKMYFDLPEEWEATEWAINFVNNHPKLISLLCQVCED